MIIAISPLTTSAVLGQGEHSRRIAAELAVLSGDITKLRQDELISQHITGLRDRIKGGLAGLDILARLADQERQQPTTPRHELIATMRDDLENNRLSELHDTTHSLLAQYPLHVPAITVTNLAPYKDLHTQLCSGCHDSPDSLVERPAFNLSQQTRTTEPVEMFARMLVGVRGDRTTGIDNPLSDQQIMGLLTYYRNTENMNSQ